MTLLPVLVPFNLLCDAFELFVFPPTWQQVGQAELRWYSYRRRATRTIYANGWTMSYVYGVGQNVYWKNVEFFWILETIFDSLNVC